LELRKWFGNARDRGSDSQKKARRLHGAADPDSETSSPRDP